MDRPTRCSTTTLADGLSRLLGRRRRCWPPAPATTPGCWRPGIATAMLFVRNPTGVSHSPAEFAEREDCLAGIGALATVLKDLAG